jgi:hypothetical protein
MLIAIALIKMFLSKLVLARERWNAERNMNCTPALYFHRLLMYHSRLSINTVISLTTIRCEDQVSYTGDYNLVFSRLKLFFRELIL